MPAARERKGIHKRFKDTHDLTPSLKLDRRRQSPPRDKSQPKPWPRRLLHVPSMTSYERGPGNKYNGIKEPSYNAISYTWGRFEDNSEPPIQIGGVTWKIPGIKNPHFTVGEFQKAIHTVANNRQFIWLDIACIDQENEAVKMDEINKQAAIFRRARTVYAWVVPWTTSEMFNAFHTVEKFHESLGYSPEGLARLEPLGSPVAADIDSVSAQYQSIARQGWFTSLWTLQEGFLSRPLFLSKSSDLLYYRTFFEGQYSLPRFPCGISWIAGKSRHIWDELRSSHDSKAVSICQSIADSGLLSMYFYRDPYLIYPAALKRHVSLPQDAVYAIMNVFGLRMPKMSNVEGLLLRLALFLNQKDPVSYQIFLHQRPVSFPDAWRVSESTHLPFQFFAEAFDGIFCKIEGNSRRRPNFIGKMTTLVGIASYWAKVQQQRRGSQKTPYQPNVFLDATQSSSCVCLELEDDPPAAEDPDIGRQDDRYTKKWPLQDLARALPFPLASYRVLLLGMKEFAMSGSKSAFVCHLRYHFGLLVRQEEVGNNKPWYRVGFSSWLISSQKDMLHAYNLGQLDQVPAQYSDWQEIQCLIG